MKDWAAILQRCEPDPSGSFAIVATAWRLPVERGALVDFEAFLSARGSR
jgi:hypothetical protein